MTQHIQQLLLQAINQLEKETPNIPMAKYKISQASQEIKEFTDFKQSDSKVEQFPLEVH